MTITYYYQEYKDKWGQTYFVERYWDKKFKGDITYWRYGYAPQKDENGKILSYGSILKDFLRSKPNMKKMFDAEPIGKPKIYKEPKQKK